MLDIFAILSYLKFKRIALQLSCLLPVCVSYNLSVQEIETSDIGYKSFYMFMSEIHCDLPISSNLTVCLHSTNPLWSVQTKFQVKGLQKKERKVLNRKNLNSLVNLVKVS